MTNLNILKIPLGSSFGLYRHFIRFLACSKSNLAVLPFFLLNLPTRKFGFQLASLNSKLAFKVAVNRNAFFHLLSCLRVQ
ncbi:hypothetical protein D3C81_1845650 [compost metagenome]